MIKKILYFVLRTNFRGTGTGTKTFSTDQSLLFIPLFNSSILSLFFFSLGWKQMILKSWCKPHLHHVFENPEITKNEQISQISKFTNFAKIKILKWKIAVFTASSCTLRYVFLRGILYCVLCSCSFHAAVARYTVEKISTLRCAKVFSNTTI